MRFPVRLLTFYRIHFILVYPATSSSPPMPVDLTVKEGGYPDSLLKPESIVSRIRTTSTGGGSNEEINYNEVAKMFDTSKA